MVLKYDPNLLSFVKSIGHLSSDGIFVYALPDQQLVYVNNAMASIFDISHESFKHQHIFFLNHVIDEDLTYLREAFAKLRKESVIEDIEFRVKSHDGTTRHIVANCYVIDTDTVVGFMKDITRIREHENYIIDYGAKKDTLLDMISYNLSGPLNLLHELTESLEKAFFKKQTNEIQEHLRFLKENTGHCLSIVNDFLEEEHLVSEHIFVKTTRFDVMTKINIMIERLRKSYPDKNFLVTTEAEAVYINSDEVKFFQIFHNVVSNAVKFTGKHGRIEIVVEESKSEIEIKVIDNGIGIPDRYKDVVFNKYTPASRPGLKGESSLAMGLYIVKRLLGLINGKIWFESKENVGSTFYIIVPKGE
jgi:two-component system, OmpR family, sensor histidine kinase VicK